MNVFDAIRPFIKSRDENVATSAAALCMAAITRRDEIDRIRADRQALREKDTRRPEINMAVTVMDMHPLELEAIKLICPDVNRGDKEAKRAAWQWVLNQPWAQELKPPSMAKRFY